jgi:hypothetical protein
MAIPAGKALESTQPGAEINALEDVFQTSQPRSGDMAKRNRRTSRIEFKEVLRATGRKPSDEASQNETRHYSETFSREIALWIRDRMIEEFNGAEVLRPEGKVDTIYGRGHKGKSLDVAVLDARKYLLVDISIKTFNFKDRKTKNYQHNFTGRFYELLGEELDLRRSYPCSSLVALIFLPEDGTRDKATSSFARCVQQFSKIAKRNPNSTSEPGFEYVFVGVYNEAGGLYFFNTIECPPKFGPPPSSMQLSFDDVLRIVHSNVAKRSALTACATLPVCTPFKFLESDLLG